MAGAFLTQNAILRGASLATPCAVPAGMPLGNLLDGQPRLRARFPLPYLDSSGGDGGWDFTTGALLGLAGERASRNVQLQSSNLAPGTGNFLIGPSATDGGAVQGVNGNNGARRLGSSSGTGGNVFFANAAAMNLPGGRTYSFGASVRRFAGSTTGNFCTIDETNGTTVTRTAGIPLASLGIGASYQRVARTITLLPDTVAVQIYWLDAWLTGTVLDLDALQVEAGSATAPIQTGATPATRDAAGAYVPVRVDLGTVQQVDCVAIIGSTLGAGARARVRLSATDPTGNAGEAWDSGLLSVPTGADAFGNIVVLRSAPVPGRFLLLELYEAGADVVDLGRIVAGLLWRMTRSHAYGIEEGRLMLDRRERNAYTGAEFPVPAVANPRTARFTLPMMTAAEGIGAHRTLLARLGAAGDTLWIPETSLAPAELALRSIWGGAAAPGEVAAANKHHRNLFSRSFAMTERI